VAAFERSEVAAVDADTLARLTMRAALHSIDRCAVGFAMMHIRSLNLLRSA